MTLQSLKETIEKLDRDFVEDLNINRHEYREIRSQMLPQLLRIAEERDGVAEKYATAARVIALHLKQFCDEKLSYDEMIADASRKAAKRIEELEKERDDLKRKLRKANQTIDELNQAYIDENI